MLVHWSILNNVLHPSEWRYIVKRLTNIISYWLINVILLFNGYGLNILIDYCYRQDNGNIPNSVLLQQYPWLEHVYVQYKVTVSDYPCSIVNLFLKETWPICVPFGVRVVLFIHSVYTMNNPLRIYRTSQDGEVLSYL